MSERGKRRKMSDNSHFFHTQDSFSKFYTNVVLRIAQQLHQIAVVAGRIHISDSFLPLWPLVD